jgi:hypothetical protein
MIKTKQSKKATKVKSPAPAPKSRALAVRKPQTKQVSTKVIDFAADQHMGMEGMTQADMAIPRLAILQALSPQCNKRDEKYIENAEPGDICDTVAGTLYTGADGIFVIPVSYRRAYTEWVPRTKGGGFVADRTPVNAQAALELQKFLDTCDRGEKGEITTPKGNEIKVSGEYFVFLVDPENGDFEPFVLNMGGSQAKKSRKWNSVMNKFKIEYNGERINPAMFYRTYKLTTVPEQNDQGSWFGWAIVPDQNVIDLPNGETIYKDARDFRQSVMAGRVSVSAPVQDDFGSTTESEDMPL